MSKSRVSVVSGPLSRRVCAVASITALKIAEAPITMVAKGRAGSAATAGKAAIRTAAVWPPGQPAQDQGPQAQRGAAHVGEVRVAHDPHLALRFLAECRGLPDAAAAWLLPLPAPRGENGPNAGMERPRSDETGDCLAATAALLM